MRPSIYSSLSVAMDISLGLAWKAFEFHISERFVQRSPVPLLPLYFDLIYTKPFGFVL